MKLGIYTREIRPRLSCRRWLSTKALKPAKLLLVSDRGVTSNNSIHERGPDPVKILTSAILALNISLSGFACDLGTEPLQSGSTTNKMYVYSSTGQKFYLIDYRTFALVKEIPLPVPNGVSLYDMAISTNRDYLFFRTWGPYNESPLGFAIYDIGKEEFKESFFTGLIHSGPVNYIAAEDKWAPGVIYAHLRDSGTYAIDLLERRVVEKISDEHAFWLAKKFYHSPDGKWDVVSKDQNAAGFSELQFYAGNSRLRDLRFVLNENNRDSIYAYDLAFSRTGDEVYVLYLHSGGGGSDFESHLGIYDLGTGQLTRSTVRGLSGYHLAYSPGRNEIYCAGNGGQIYVIDGNTCSTKTAVALPVNATSAPPIVVSPDENSAMIACYNDIFVIDLDNRKIIKRISLQGAYWMVIP